MCLLFAGRVNGAGVGRGAGVAVRKTMARRYNVFHHRAAKSKTIKRLINRTFRVISFHREHVNGRWNSEFSEVCEINSAGGAIIAKKIQ